MSASELIEKLQRFQTSLHELYRSAASGQRDKERLLRSAYKELGLASEEIQVAIEEMTLQAEELALARMKLEAERKYYKNLFEFLPDAYLVTDERGTIVQANPASAELLEVEAARFLPGKPLDVFLTPSERREFPVKLLQLGQNERARTWTLRVQPRRGSERTVEASAFPRVDRHGGTLTLHWNPRASEENGNGRADRSIDRDDPRQTRPKRVYTQGENIPIESDRFWLVCQGWVKLCAPDSRGEIGLLGLVGPAMPFGSGMTSLAEYRAIALSDSVQLVSIARSELEKSSAIRELVLPQLLSRLSQAESLLLISRTRQIRERLNLLLQWLKTGFGQPVPGGIRLSVRLTHREPASICGTTRVTVSRTLGKMREEGRITYDSDRHLVFRA
jgi:PAS domain S-box-containing protein